MSELSRAECAAGISRAALATYNQAENRNGNKPKAPAPIPDRRRRVDREIPKAAQEILPPAPEPIISTQREPVPELTHVILTYCRQLDIINVNGWSFELRNTVHQLGNVHASRLYLSRPELEKLESTIRRVLAEAGPPRAEE